MTDDLRPTGFRNERDPMRIYLSFIPLFAAVVAMLILTFTSHFGAGSNPFYHNEIAAFSSIGAGALISSVLMISSRHSTPKTVSVGTEGYTMEYGKGRLVFVRYERVVSVEVRPNFGGLTQEDGRGKVTQTNADGMTTIVSMSGVIARAIEERRLAFTERGRSRTNGLAPNGIYDRAIPEPAQPEVERVRVPPMVISKGLATYATRITIVLMPVITLVVLLLASGSGGIAGVLFLFGFTFLAFQMFRKLKALSDQVTVRPEGLALYDAPSLVYFSVWGPSPVPISRGEISCIRVADTLERKAYRRKPVPGRSDMVISTKAGKDYFLMKRPTDELLRAAWMLGFPQGSENRPDRESFVPMIYKNTVDRVTEQRGYPIIALLVFLVFAFLTWTIQVLGFVWIGAIGFTLFFLMVPLFLFLVVRNVSRSRFRNPDQVTVGLNGFTLIFRNGKALYVDFYDLEAVFTIFRSSLGDDGKRLKRGLIRVNRKQIVSLSPEIVFAIREAYRTSRDYYPTVSPF